MFWGMLLSATGGCTSAPPNSLFWITHETGGVRNCQNGEGQEPANELVIRFIIEKIIVPLLLWIQRFSPTVNSDRTLTLSLASGMQPINNQQHDKEALTFAWSALHLGSYSWVMMLLRSKVVYQSTDTKFQYRILCRPPLTHSPTHFPSINLISFWKSLPTISALPPVKLNGSNPVTVHQLCPYTPMLQSFLWSCRGSH